MRCRQPEKILLPPELPVLLAESVELGSLFCAEQALVFRTGLAAVDAGLPDPASEAAGGQAKAVGYGIAREVLLQAELNSLSLLLRREPAPGLRGGDHR